MRSYFVRALMLHAAAFLAAALFSEIYITDALRESSIGSLKRAMLSEAAMAARQVDFGAKHGSLDGLAAGIKALTGSRMTILDSQGDVLGDSDAKSAGMENHASRHEVQQAALDGSGMSIRRSATLSEELLYVAMAVGETGSPVGFIRMARPLTEVNAAANALRMRVLGFVLIALAASSLVSIVQIRRAGRLLSEVEEFSSALAKGRFDQRLMMQGRGEFDAIARNLNAMAGELSMLATVERDRLDRMSVILQHVPDAMLILDQDDRVAMHSLAAADVFGRAGLVGSEARRVLRDSAFISMLHEARRTGAAQDGEIEIEAMPRTRHFHVMVSPVIKSASEQGELVALFHEITEVKLADQVRRDFVANVSHELRTPVSAIKGFADTLASGAIHDKENAMRFIGIIQSNSERITRLIEDLLTISRLEHGSMKIEKEALDAAQIVRQALGGFEQRAAQKGLALAADRSLEGLSLEADRHRLMQVMTNLIDNAIKHTDSGGVTVGADKDEGGAYLYVSDTGSGIPERHIPRLGERFYRVDSSRSRELGGTGLGLAIVKHIVRAHGWGMGIESVVGIGTKVKIYFSR